MNRWFKYGLLIAASCGVAACDKQDEIAVDVASGAKCDALAADPMDPNKVSPGVKDTDVNLKEAQAACSVAARLDPGNARIAFQFGRVLSLSGFARAAVDSYATAARKGYAIAAYYAGNIYQRGNGIEADHEHAKAMYAIAYKGGFLLAGEALADAPGARDDALPGAEKLYTDSANLGSMSAAHKLGKLFVSKRQSSRAIEWFDKAIENGYVPAYAAKADIYLTDSQDAASMEKALELLRHGEEKNDPDAYYALWKVYTYGKGVDKNIKRAAEYLRKAGDLKQPLALSELYKAEAREYKDQVLLADIWKGYTRVAAGRVMGDPAPYHTASIVERGKVASGSNAYLAIFNDVTYVFYVDNVINFDVMWRGPKYLDDLRQLMRGEYGFTEEW